jgi:hypothetical protein
MQELEQERKTMSSIRLSSDIKAQLVRIGARLSLKDGKARSMEDVIVLLLKEYKANHKDDEK